MKKPLLRRIFSRIARPLGYELMPRKPLDLRGTVSDPLEAIYLSGLRSSVIDVPLAHCRSSLAFPYGDGQHPFAATLRAHRDGKSSRYSGSTLEAQHKAFQPQTIAECFALDLETGQDWKRLPPQARVMPWDSISPMIKLKRVEQRLVSDNIQRGRKLPPTAGMGIRGPVAPEKGELEYHTLVQLMRSIETRGYQRHDGPDGDIFAVALVSLTGDTRFLVRKGTHRISTLDALAYKTIPIRLTPAKAIRVSDAPFWPHVRDGMYRLDEAVTIFNRIFDGQPVQLDNPH